MSFPRYPKYKASGVEWLAEVPEHWETAQLRHFVDIKNGTDHKHVEQNEGFPVYGSGGIFAYASDFLYDGEAVLLGRKGTIDKPLYVNGPFWTVDTMYWTKIRPNTSGRYAYYAATTFPFALYSTNTALPSMTKGVLSGHVMARPPLPEQTAIAEFLDRETGKIDGLVAEQRRLMELLKEKRQAVISHAVTKGLNPHAPMKPSGIKWLGDVPTHWTIGALAYFARIRSGSTPNRENPTFWGGNIPWVKTGEINYTTIIKTEESITSAALLSCSLPLAQPGTLLMALYGEGATRGRVAVLGIAATFNQACAAIVPDSRISSGYLQGVLLSAYEFVREIGNETTQMNLNLDFVRNLKVSVPPMREQEAIVNVLESESAKFDSLTAETQRAIDLLQERRTALISAAVTGQIDVRQQPQN